MSEVLEESSPEPPAPFVPPAPEALERMLPRYEITQLIAHGGMGAVYGGVQRDLERPVAIKILPPDAARDKEAIDRFRTEARAMARLSHPHIPAVFDFEVIGEFCVLVMELVEGPNVYTLIHKGQVTPPQALELLSQVCDAVQFAHSREIVHGDIKPGNILLTKDGQVKLGDFGLARLMGQGGGDDAESWTPMGTPEYAAPELYDKNASPDHRADIYSLGVVLHEMLTGAPPVGEFELPGEALGLDPRVDEIIARCMELNPDSRYQSAQEVRVVLRDIIEGRDVPVPEKVKTSTKRIIRATRKAPPGAKTGTSKKKSPSQAIPQGALKKGPGAPRTETRPPAGKGLPVQRTKVVVVEGARPSANHRNLLIGAAVVVVGIVVWQMSSKDDGKDLPDDKKGKTVQEGPPPAPPPEIKPDPVPPAPTPSPAPTPAPTPPPDPVVVKEKPPEPPPVEPKKPPTPVPTKAYALIHALRITQRDEWNKRVETKLKEDFLRLSGKYAELLKKLEDQYLAKAEASMVLEVRAEAVRFDKTLEGVKPANLSKLPALAKNQQALNVQVSKLRAAVKAEADAVKEAYMLGLREIEKQMDDAEDKAGSKVVSDEFLKVTKLSETDLRNYFNAEDAN